MSSASAAAPAPPDVATHFFAAEGLGTVMAYAELLATEGIVRGVIGPRETPRLWSRHLLNSVAVTRAVPPGAVVVDIGSGAGLPGLPLAIARPDVQVHLVEPMQRRATWLREMVRQLGMADRVVIHQTRAEDGLPVAGDVVVSRAVAPLRRLLPWCARWCRGGGLVIAIKGENAEHELSEVMDDVVAWGLSAPSVARFATGVLTPPTVAVLCRRLSEPENAPPPPRGTPPRGSERERTSHVGRHRPGRDRP